MYRAPPLPTGSQDLFAWVVLLTSPWYLPGVMVLAYSLRKVRSKYPLIVAVTPSLPEETANALVEFGLEIRLVEALRPRTKVPVVAHRFEDTWTKLTVFGFEGLQVNTTTYRPHFLWMKFDWGLLFLLSFLENSSAGR